MKNPFKSSKNDWTKKQWNKEEKRPEASAKENKKHYESEEFLEIEQFFPEESYAYENPYVSHLPTKAASTPVVAPAYPNAKTTQNVQPPVQNIVPGKNPKGKQPYVYTPRITEKKLTIILVEDTTEMAKQEAILVDLYKRCKSDILTVIHYGEKVRVSTVETLKFFKKDDDDEVKCFKCSENAGDNACFSDALLEVSKIVSENYNKVKEKNFIKMKISNIDIIGIGTCKDNCSETSKEKGIECFCKMLKDTNIASKYFCLTEEYFLEAAEFGFRSIGSISRSY